MTIGERVKERMELKGISQAELARRIGVAQPTIFKMVHGQTLASRHLHRMARELGTTPAYLNGESDDPEKDLPPPADLDAETRELVDQFNGLSPADRRALLQVARSMAHGPKSSGTVHPPPPAYEGKPSESAASGNPDPNSSDPEQNR